MQLWHCVRALHNDTNTQVSAQMCQLDVYESFQCHTLHATKENIVVYKTVLITDYQNRAMITYDYGHFQYPLH